MGQFVRKRVLPHGTGVSRGTEGTGPAGTQIRDATPVGSNDHVHQVSSVQRALLVDVVHDSISSAAQLGKDRGDAGGRLDVRRVAVSVDEPNSKEYSRVGKGDIRLRDEQVYESSHGLVRGFVQAAFGAIALARVPTLGLFAPHDENINVVATVIVESSSRLGVVVVVNETQ